MSHNDRFYEYRICLNECPEARWFEGLDISQTPAGMTVIVGAFDQSALRGVLNRIFDLGLELVSLQRMPVRNDAPDRDKDGSG